MSNEDLQFAFLPTQTAYLPRLCMGCSLQQMEKLRIWEGGGRDRLCTQSLGSTVHFRILKFKPLVLLLVMSVVLPNLGTLGGLATAPSGAPGREAVGTEACQPSLLTHPPFLLVSPDTHNLTICRGKAAR